MTPLVAISAGDPGGIGPEVVAAALADPARRARARWLVFCPARAFFEACAARHSDVCILPAFPSFTLDPAPGAITLVEPPDPRPRDPFPAHDDRRSGEISFWCVQRAIDAALLPRDHPSHAHAIVTGPISKRAWALAGHAEFPGHTELLAARCNAPHAAMMFHAPPAPSPTPAPGTPPALPAGLNVILATVHRPLRDVPALLTTPRLVQIIRLGHDTMRRLGVDRPRVGVCGLNPHAGEEGLLGSEDRDIIAPAVTLARAAGIDASGPHPADTMFAGALAFPGLAPARFDLAVAMYHDQGLIPLKTLARDRAVNFTVGLPIVRTSPDHGTAFDIAGTHAAHPGSTAAAIDLALRLAGV
ncbi:MAG: 4-hydroxythreonine-4-phosphate dehydrogenase PdxA [Planctomycetota bacterium]|nr:4-hydroxythreonine-4-phosphate dehydrogenase PdxA [Planctomycetota bacterium]